MVRLDVGLGRVEGGLGENHEFRIFSIRAPQRERRMARRRRAGTAIEEDLSLRKEAK
jgi:hypothetical protein